MEKGSKQIDISQKMTNELAVCMWSSSGEMLIAATVTDLMWVTIGTIKEMLSFDKNREKNLLSHPVDGNVNKGIWLAWEI